MSRKAKKKVHKMPPLCFLDKCIYTFLFVIGISIALAVFVIPIVVGDRIIFSDEAVIAGENYFAWAFIPFFAFLVIPLAVVGTHYQDRHPIFGLRDFKYGPPNWPKVYPLLMKNKPPVWMSEKKKASRKQTAVVLVLILLLSFIPYPFAFYGRECLRKNGSVVQYNGFNVPVREFSSGEISQVEFKAYKHSTGSRYARIVNTRYDVQVKLTTDSGKKYTFEFHNFQKGEEGELLNWLTQMLQLKRRYSPEIITYDGLEYLEDVVSGNGLTDEETKLLYQLFGQA